jgi:hypothetical protein
MKKESDYKMDKQQILDSIFADDASGILEVRAPAIARTTDEMLLSKFQEIVDFYIANNREPESNPNDINEFQLHVRLKALRESPEKIAALEDYDQFGLLKIKAKEINSFDDIFDDDNLDVLGGDDEGLFDFEHTPKQQDINKTDFVAQRKPCKDFDKYEQQFKDVHSDLKSGKRKIIPFQEKQLQESGNYFVHNGVLLYLETINDLAKDRFKKADGRTKVIFENGTESNMKLRSLGKNLFKNGKAITVNKERINEDFIKTFNDITDEDDEAGFIYVLESESVSEQISSIANLHKIGYSKSDVPERIKNAKHDPTYLMASVSIVGIWQCFNMNPQKFEQLLHNFFGEACLDLDVFDDNGKRHRPQEWFIVPIEVVNQAIEMIISGVIVNYRYDQESESIVLR